MNTATEEQKAAMPDDILDIMLDTYALWPSGSGYVINMHEPDAQPMTMSALKTAVRPWAWAEGKRRVNPADAWADDHRRVHVAGIRFDPTTTARIVEHDGRRYVNSYTGIPHKPGEADPDAVEVFTEFLAHLVPNERERDWFTQWLAAKVQRPWTTNSAVLMVHEEGGAGRGTLFDMLKAVFGRANVSAVTNTELMGSGGQGQYTAWLADSLLVLCDEVLADGGSDGAMAWKRRQAYEKLKAVADTRAREAKIIRKHLPNVTQMVYTSFLLATNNPNAIPLAAQDRRFTVILNGDTLVSNPDLMERLKPWRGQTGFKEAFGQAVFRHLLTVDVDFDLVREALRDTEGRAEMLAANEGDAEDLLCAALDGLTGDYVVFSDMRDCVAAAAKQAGLEGEFPKLWRRAQDILSGPNTVGWRRMGGPKQNVQPTTDGAGNNTARRAVMLYRESVGIQPWMQATLHERPALWRHATAAVRAGAAVTEIAKKQRARKAMDQDESS
jgi:hypothetical protein